MLLEGPAEVSSSRLVLGVVKRLGKVEEIRHYSLAAVCLLASSEPNAVRTVISINIRVTVFSVSSVMGRIGSLISHNQSVL